PTVDKTKPSTAGLSMVWVKDGDYSDFSMASRHVQFFPVAGRNRTGTSCRAITYSCKSGILGATRLLRIHFAGKEALTLLGN
ncbi:MAG: hypothetical protein ACK53L_14625, partial [Pirellulaceae bacterium]